MRRRHNEGVPTLVAESFAPWSEKARWALDHHGIRYDYREHVPLLGEPWLRWRLGKLTGRVSTPTLLTDAASYEDSFAIAEWAERHGSGAPLLPPGRRTRSPVWNARSEAALSAGRVRVVARIDESPAPGPVLPPTPVVLQPLLGVATSVTVAFLRWKYDFDTDVAASGRTLGRRSRGSAPRLAGRDHLLEGFSYADITMAVVLQMVRPVADTFIRLEPAVREVWTNDPPGRRLPSSSSPGMTSSTPTTVPPSPPERSLPRFGDPATLEDREGGGPGSASEQKHERGTR
jgi:glutathione S-transferase